MHFNKGLIATSLLVILAGCGGSDDDSDYDWDNTTYKPLKSNTKGAAGFAFTTEGSTYGEVNDYGGIASRTMTNGSCSALVKVVEVEVEHPDSDPDNTEFITEKVLSSSNANNCFIYEVHSMKEHLILEGDFSQLADVSGKEIEQCFLIALPIDDSNGLAECLIYSDNFDKGYTDPRITNLNVTGDGKGLQIMYQHERSWDSDLDLPTLGYWDNNAAVTTIYQFPTEVYGADVAAAWSYDGTEFYLSQNRDDSWTHPAHRNASSGGIGFDRNYYSPLPRYSINDRAVEAGEYVITNHRSFGDEYGNVVLNTKEENPFIVSKFYLNGNSGTLNVLEGREYYSYVDDDYVHFSGSFYAEDSNESTYQSYFRVARSQLDQHHIEVEETFSIWSYTTYESMIGDTYHLYLSKGNLEDRELTYLDLKTGEHVDENILSRPEFDAYDNFEIRKYVNGLKIIATSFFGDSAELFLDQLTGEITENPIDRQEIGGTIPLYPSL
ncbi:hypothetical protein L4D20_18200 [Vibrio kyushuensis]|uniref:hypothetical protein n=1 Tax=Vibrio kyushuensis TaxID=2910249 RepID=UPI003D0A11B2